MLLKGLELLVELEVLRNPQLFDLGEDLPG